jgi:predicted SAM-dependent methyltransferase
MNDIKRLNWGCGHKGEPGWINSDLKDGPGIDISCDILEGLPLESDTMDYIVSIHALPMIPYTEIVRALQELKRVLKPGGVLRLGLPDFDKGIRAYQQNERDYFFIPDDETKSISGKLIVQLIWYGYSRTMFTYEFAEELIQKAGFQNVRQCNYQETFSAFDEITSLDNRERESFFVEAVK